MRSAGEDRRLHPLPAVVRVVPRPASRGQRARRRLDAGPDRHPRAHPAARRARSTTPPSAAAPGCCCGWTCSTAPCGPTTGSTPSGCASADGWSRWPPAGGCSTTALVDELAAEEELTLLCGRYEGFDERILEHFASDVVSIGRYVLSGGELPAMVLCDAVMRKLPGALGDEHSAQEESYSAALEGLPEYPHYTRPAEYRGWRVPDVLLSGHHERIEQWRREQSRARGAGRGGHRGRPLSRRWDRSGARRRSATICSALCHARSCTASTTVPPP